MEPPQKKKLIARFVEIRGTAQAEKREESEGEKKELAEILQLLEMDAEQIYAAFAAAYPAA